MKDSLYHTISYVSTSINLSDRDVNELLTITKLKNEELGITGILMHSEQNFFQIIEGETKTIKNLYKKIEKDIRHFNLIKIFDKPIDIPSFKTFQSSYTVINKEKNYSELQSFLESEKNHNPENFKNISYIANKFMKLY
ncbi:BLUF domain-containing protein [Aquimarina litoralis]|uniref:BLUF domain-containing protein n=1 Tax=Aquimarina litoralis TaxID=584605 RepID=UPI001C55BC52|nr:BLUF domain-containing protein [Aquimarina litoralis]MBW1294224.1 blue light sensor protein [Aquimarina litoralis]